jgi:hypothetical protein
VSNFEIPLTPTPQIFNFQLAGVELRLSWVWNPVAVCWVLDILDKLGAPLVTGIPVVTGVDLLGQFRHLGIAQAIVVQTDNNPNAVPTFSNLGITSHCYLFELT